MRFFRTKTVVMGFLALLLVGLGLCPSVADAAARSKPAEAWEITPEPAAALVKPSQPLRFVYSLTPARQNDSRLERLQQAMSLRVRRATVFVWNKDQRWLQHPVEFNISPSQGKLVLETSYIPEGGWIPEDTYVAVLDPNGKSSSFGPDCDLVTRLLPGKVLLALRGEMSLPSKLKGSLKELRVGDIVRVGGSEILSRHYRSRQVLSTWFSVGPDESIPTALEVRSAQSGAAERIGAKAGEPVELFVSTFNAYGDPVNAAIVCEVTEHGTRVASSARVEGPTPGDGSGNFKFSVVDTEAEDVEVNFSTRSVGDRKLSAGASITFAPSNPTMVTVSADPACVKPMQQCVLRGNVTDAFGNPVPSVQVSVRLMGTASGALGPFLATTDGSGAWAYAISSSQPELLWAEVSLEGGASARSAAIRCAEATSDTSWKLEFVVPGQPVEGTAIVYSEGKLTGLPGTAPPYWWVSARANEALLGMAQASADGSWMLGCVRQLSAGESISLTFSQAKPETELPPQPAPTVLTFEGSFGWGQTSDNGIRYFDIPRECDVVFEYYSLEQVNTAYHNQNLYFLVYPPGSTTYRRYAPGGRYTVHLPQGKCKLVLSTSLGISRARMVITVPTN